LKLKETTRFKEPKIGKIGKLMEFGVREDVYSMEM
jgi:hypothetical protein